VPSEWVGLAYRDCGAVVGVDNVVVVDIEVVESAASVDECSVDDEESVEKVVASAAAAAESAEYDAEKVGAVVLAALVAAALVGVESPEVKKQLQLGFDWQFEVAAAAAVAAVPLEQFELLAVQKFEAVLRWLVVPPLEVLPVGQDNHHVIVVLDE